MIADRRLLAVHAKIFAVACNAPLWPARTKKTRRKAGQKLRRGFFGVR